MVLAPLLFAESKAPLFARSIVDQASGNTRCEFVRGWNYSSGRKILILPDGQWSIKRYGSACVVSARSFESIELVVTWLNGAHETLSLANPPEDFRIVESGKYLLVTERTSRAGEGLTEVFRLEPGNIKRLGQYKARGLTVLSDQILLAVRSGRQSVTYTVKPIQGEKANGAFNTQLLALARGRQKFWQNDPWHYSGNGDIRPPINFYLKQDNILISPNGQYWFEKAMRVYVIGGENSARFFSGHILVDGKGLVSQWKYHRDSVHGIAFTSPTRLRMLWTEDFLFGKVQLSQYGPGVYDLDVKSNRLLKQKVDPQILKANPPFILVD